MYSSYTIHKPEDATIGTYYCQSETDGGRMARWLHLSVGPHNIDIHDLSTDEVLDLSLDILKAAVRFIRSQ